MACKPHMQCCEQLLDDTGNNTLPKQLGFMQMSYFTTFHTVSTNQFTEIWHCLHTGNLQVIVQGCSCHRLHKQIKAVHLEPCLAQFVSGFGLNMSDNELHCLLKSGHVIGRLQRKPQYSRTESLHDASVGTKACPDTCPLLRLLTCQLLLQPEHQQQTASVTCCQAAHDAQESAAASGRW